MFSVYVCVCVRVCIRFFGSICGVSILMCLHRTIYSKLLCIFLRVFHRFTNRDFPRVRCGAVSNMYVAFAACFFTSISRRESLVSVCLRVPELNRVSVLVLVGRGEERRRLGGRREKGEGRERQKLKSHAGMERTEKRGRVEGEKAKTEEPKRRWGFPACLATLFPPSSASG